MEQLKKIEWDVIIFDEAHRLRRDSLKSTQAYNAAQILAEKTKNLLLLTATPFRGKLEELYYLVRLLDKNLLGPFQTFYNTHCLNGSDGSSIREKLSSVIIRRTKSEVGGFTRRQARTIRFEFFPEERELYDHTTNYVVEEFNLAMATENRAVGFVMTVFQKLLDSSCAALLSALVKRRDRLAVVLERMKGRAAAADLLLSGADSPWSVDEYDDSEDFPPDAVSKNVLELGREISTLDRLIGLAQNVSATKKGEKLKELITRISATKNRKVLIFTQFRTTQDYLRDILADFNVEIFNGSMDKNRKEEAIARFRDSADILISTEAGGEGRNLQFCSILVNYDLPWSPLKIEQRIGRIHRFGQTKDVQIYNFSVKDTISERVLAVLTRKLKLFEESIGTPDILLGQIEEELNFNRIFMEMAAGKSQKKINEELDTKIEAAKKNYEKLADLAVARRMDFNYDEFYRVTLMEREFSNRKIEDFVEKLRAIDPVVERFLGKKHGVRNLYPVKALPESGGEQRKFGTFDSAKALENDDLEFLAFGNPIVDHLFSHCRGATFGGRTGIRIIRYPRPFTGIFINYLITFRGATEFQEIIPVVSTPLYPMTGEERMVFENGFTVVEPHPMAGYTDVDDHRERISRTMELHLHEARRRVAEKVKKRVGEVHSDIDRSLIPELEKIADSYDKKILEYEKQLEHQMCQMKWFDKDMKSAITRTKSKILDAVRERESEMDSRREFLNIGCRMEVLNACIVVAKE